MKLLIIAEENRIRFSIENKDGKAEGSYTLNPPITGTHQQIQGIRNNIDEIAENLFRLNFELMFPPIKEDNERQP